MNWKKILIWAVVIIYVIMPVDLVPDIPLIGWIDDMAVILIGGFINRWSV